MIAGEVSADKMIVVEMRGHKNQTKMAIVKMIVNEMIADKMIVQ